MHAPLSFNLSLRVVPETERQLQVDKTESILCCWQIMATIIVYLGGALFTIFRE
jgi:hypothetical protein